MNLIKKSIIEAARNKANVQRADYRIKAVDAKNDAFYVRQNATNATYAVDTVLRRCTCPAFANDGFCKHYAMVQDELAYTADVARRADEYAANEAEKQALAGI